MSEVRKLSRVAVALVVLCLCAGTAFPAFSAAAPQSTELWGGPGAKGTGLFGATFDTTVYVGAVLPASVTIDFFQGGKVAASRSGTVAERGVTLFSAPSELSDKGPFFYRIHSDVAVTAWSETFNSTSEGEFGLSVDAFLATDFLQPGDEASGAGAEASTSNAAGRSRTNVGIFCTPSSPETCRMEVAAFNQGALLGTGTVDAVAASAAQKNLAELIPATADHTLLSLRFRVLAGTGTPYAIKNHNDTSDAARIPLAVTRFAFSTAPTVNSFTATPSSGCSPQQVNLAWTTTGAARVVISGVSGDLPPNGSTTTTLLTTTDLVLTAFSSTGQTTSVPRHVTILPPTLPPTPSVPSASLITGEQTQGLLPLPNGITASFVQHQSTGSTIVVNGSIFTYTAGSTAGVDIVRFTLAGPCGNATADFTATVSNPGAPQILSFSSDPTVGCAPANVVLYWQTKDVRAVTITDIDNTQPANGAFGLVLNATKTFTLTAFGFNGDRVTQDLTVEISPGLQTPILNVPTNLTVAPSSTTEIFVTGVDDPTLIRTATVQDQTGGRLQFREPGHYTYFAGSGSGNQDIFDFTYTNGCGRTATELTVTIGSP